MKKVMLVFGTRPEAIKICPLVNELKKRKSIQTVVCVTAQHRQMLDQVLKTFNVIPDYDLDVMKNRQTLFDITINILNGIKGVLEKEKPDVVLVHGDTSTTFVTALACFYLQIPVGHVEAGLRTYNIYSPYPEEFNREAVSIVSQYNFAPTPLSRSNLLKEGRKNENIYVTGNTVIDAMQHTVKDNYAHPELEWVGEDKLIFITAHRRENLGEPMHHMFRAIKRVLDEHPDCKAIYPIHMNRIYCLTVRMLIQHSLYCPKHMMHGFTQIFTSMSGNKYQLILSHPFKFGMCIIIFNCVLHRINYCITGNIYIFILASLLKQIAAG